jgi:hypothetical protein
MNIDVIIWDNMKLDYRDGEVVHTAIMTESVTPYCWAMTPAAGAIMAEEIGLSSVKRETMTVAVHFRFSGQLEDK